MPDLQKVIEALETCKDNCLDQCQDGVPCAKRIIEDALILLKACIPRVMTYEEADEALHKEQIIYAESMRQNGRHEFVPGIRATPLASYFEMQNGDVIWQDDLQDPEIKQIYGKRVRQWTAYPTEEQMKEVPWE